MRIIPAIDIIQGKCVRLTKGDFASKKVYSDSPLDLAKKFEDSGIEYLHLVDLDGAKAQKVINYKVLEQIAVHTKLNIDFGGVLKTDQDLKIAFESGADQITGGSIAVKNPELFKSWLDIYGPKKIILGADVMDEKIAVHGWQEASKEALLPFIKKYLEAGIDYVICTDISKDGMLMGPSFNLYQKIIKTFDTKIKLIASGGVSSIEELPKIEQIGCEGLIIGKAIYENKISLKELETFIINNKQ